MPIELGIWKLSAPSQTPEQSALANHSPEELLECGFQNREDRAILERELESRGFNERERIIVLLREAEPKIKLSEIAQLLNVSERVVKSNLRLLRYHCNRPAATPTRKRRKNDSEKS